MDTTNSFDEIHQEMESRARKLNEYLEVDLETITDEYIAKALPEGYEDIIDEIKDDEEYKYLTSMPVELVESTAQFNFKMYQIVRELTAANPVAPPYCATKELQEMEMLKCKYDIVYFATNYVYIPVVGGIVKYEANSYLKAKLRLIEASVLHLFMTSRQSSKTQTDLVGALWYFLFWARSKQTLVNTKLEENEKNLRNIMAMLERVPKWMNTFKEDHPDTINNIRTKISPTKSELMIGVVDRVDPASSLRGRTCALFIDEVAYLKGISVAYSAIAFITNTYSKMAKKMYVPSPFSLVSTPNSINLENGAFWFEMWQNAYEVSYDEIKDLLPHEIRAYFNKLGHAIVKIEQPWYTYPGRARRDDVETLEFRKKYHSTLMNPDAPIEEIEKIDKDLASWLLETKATCRTLSNIKKDIYCMFLTGTADAIFEEEVLDNMYKSKRFPIRTEKIPGVLDGDVAFYKELKPSEGFFRYFTVFDFAWSISGDYLGAIILDREDLEIVARVRLRPGSVRKGYPVIKYIVEKLFNNELSFAIERNSAGVACVEDCMDDSNLRSKLYFEMYKSKYGERNIEKKVYGINTTKENRPVAISEFITYAIENQYVMKDEELIKEIIGLIEKNGKVQAAPGLHDDLVMSLALSLYILLYKDEIVKRISLTSRGMRNKYQRMASLNDPYGNNHVISKEEEESDKYKYYEEQFKSLRENQLKADNLFARLNK